MPNYAIIQDNVVVNIIIADNKDIAESSTGMAALEMSEEIGIGWTLELDGWRSPKPYASWEWDGHSWSAPKPFPDEINAFSWSENAQDWIMIPNRVKPFPSWKRSNNGEFWISPVSFPEDGRPYHWNEKDQKWEIIEDGV